MPSYSRSEVILVEYPYSDFSAIKVRPAVVVSGVHPSQDLLIVPLTSRVQALLPGEFVLTDWKTAGLNVATAAKRGVYTVHESLIVRSVGRLTRADALQLDQSLRSWLQL